MNDRECDGDVHDMSSIPNGLGGRLWLPVGLLQALFHLYSTWEFELYWGMILITKRGRKETTL